jgi:chromate transporter
MTAIAIGLGRYTGPSAVRDSLEHAFTLVAVAVVAQAVVTMARSLCPDWPRAMIAIAAMTLVLGLGGPWAALLAVVCGALAGVVAGRCALPAPAPTAPRAGKPGLAALLVLPVVALAALGWRGHGIIALAAIFARTGALVFGGGHVVLPLLRDALVPGQWISDSTFLAGYGVVQAMPGPLFTFAAYLGAACAPAGGGWGLAALYALVATIAIFLPGLLLAIGAQSVWQWLGHHVRAQTALAGINAAVVGVLAAALINPVARSALLGLHDCVIAAIGLILLLRWHLPPIVVVGLTLLASVIWR